MLMTGAELFDVFSTYVEVILSREPVKEVVLCILHVCGGDPNYLLIT